MKNLPTLDDLINDSSLAKTMSCDEATGMLSRLMALQATLMVQAVSSREQEHQTSGDRLLKVEEVAYRLNCDTDWVYRKADKLPFACRLSPRQLRFSEKGLEKYIAKLSR